MDPSGFVASHDTANRSPKHPPLPPPKTTLPFRSQSEGISKSIAGCAACTPAAPGTTTWPFFMSRNDPAAVRVAAAARRPGVDEAADAGGDLAGALGGGDGVADVAGTAGVDGAAGVAGAELPLEPVACAAACLH